MRWVLLGFALIAAPLACAHVRPGPPAEAWPVCEAICGHQGGISLGIILPEPDGPIGCACATDPKAFDKEET